MTTSTTTAEPLRAFHGDAKIKRKYLARVRAHRKADEIIAGIYWEERGERMMGCAVGCTLHSNKHAAYETELGIPRIRARLEDRLFEGLWAHGNRDAAKEWPEKFLAAAKTGADLSMVWPKFAHWLLIDEKCGVIRHAEREKTRKAIERVAALYARWIAGDKPAAAEWNAASAASAADASAAAYARGKHYTAMADKLIELMRAA